MDWIRIPMFKRLKHFIVLLSFFILGGCASSVVLQTTASIPQPLVQPFPFKTAVYYPEKTRNHSYREDSRDGRRWAITTGESQTALLDRVLKSLFTPVATVNDLESVSEDYDLVIVPTITDMQFALPQETQFDYYEAWVEYELLIKQPSGETIATFSFRGYGKSDKSFFDGDEVGLRNASNRAFRDLGAKLIVMLQQHPDFEKWRLAKNNEASGK